jgi:Nuclease-related domain
LKRVAVIAMVGVAMLALSTEPVGAVPSTTSTPTTLAPGHLSGKASAAMSHLFIALVVLGGLSLLVEEVGRGKKKRRRRNPPVRASVRGPRPKTAAAMTKRQPAKQPAPRARPSPVVRVDPSQQRERGSTPPPPAAYGHMWGRRPGQSVRERIAELDAERAMWARGEQGEILVGEELDRLPPNQWWVFHAIPRGGSGTDIDHLVIGVGGVYTINTKNVSANVWVAGRVLMVGGKKTNYLPAATSEARDAARRIASKGGSVDVRPVLVFTRPVTIRAMPADVAVLQAETVRTWLEHQPQVLTPWHAYELVLVADQQATWT